jgi:hypothetical protein
MAGETAAMRRLRSGVPLSAAELLKTERLLADHLHRHGNSRPVRVALEDVRARIDLTDARTSVAAEVAAARTAASGAAGIARVGGTVRHEGFSGVRFGRDLRPPSRRSRGRSGAVSLIVAVVAAAMVGAVGLGHDDEPAATRAGGDTSTASGGSAGVPSGAVDAGALTGGPLQVSRAGFLSGGRDWPLTVEAGALTCDGAGSVVFTADSGGTYAVNGTARTHTPWPGIDSIWADAPGRPGLKVDLGELTEAGLALC